MITLDLTQVKANRIVEIKTEAGKRITDRYPVWKQNNMQARVSELMDKKVDGTITAEETSELDYYKTTVWGWIKQVRDASDLAEAQIMTDECNTVELVEGVTPVWPA